MSTRNYFYLSSFFVLISILLRLPGLYHDFWLDEIWSYNNVSTMSSPIEVFTFHHDNNHPLNSLFMYILGTKPPSGWVKYRILSFVLGAGTIAAVSALLWGMFKESFTKILALVFFFASFPLVVYSTEARGYGPAIFFSVLSLYLLQEYIEKERPWISVAFQACLVLGFLSHLQFTFVAAGLFLLCIWRAREKKQVVAVYALKLFLLPGVVALLVYVPFLLDLTIGGGYILSELFVMKRFSGFVFGHTYYGTLGYIMASIVAAFLLIEVVLLLKERHNLGIFTLGLLVFPAAILTKRALTGTPLIIAQRYFVLLAPFLYPVAAHALYRLSRRARWGMPCALMIALLIAGGNIARDVRFLREGRGQYLKALTFIYQNTPSPEVVISSDHDFRNGTLLFFYDQYIEAGKSLIYVPSNVKLPEGTEWYITHNSGRRPEVPPLIMIYNRIHYRLLASYPYSGETSGHQWNIYRRE